MLSIILMIKMRYVVLPLLGVLFLIWSKFAIKDLNSSDTKEAKGISVAWAVIVGIAIVIGLLIGFYFFIEFTIDNW